MITNGLTGTVTNATTALSKEGTGTQTLTGANTYTGGTSLKGGVLSVGSAGAIGSSGTISFTGGTLQYTAANTTDYSARFSNAASQQYQVDTNSQSVTLASSLTSVGGSFTKSGSGTLTLSGANTYTGNTLITQGTLALGASGSIGNSSEVRISSGATLDVAAATGFTISGIQTLSGGGTVVGNTTIAGTHSPGFSPGIQAFSDNLSYTTGSSIVWELIDNTTAGRGENYDGIDVGAALSFDSLTSLDLAFDLSGSTVSWADTAFWSSNPSWLLFSTDSPVSGLDKLSINTTNWIDGFGEGFDSYWSGSTFGLSEDEGGVFLTFNAIPEPSHALLVGLGCAGLTLRRRRS